MAKGLGKKFIDSVVGQIGRDAGRVVSNQVFGDAHAIKISSKASSDPVLLDEKHFISDEITNYSGAYIEDEGFVDEKGFEHDKPLGAWVVFFSAISAIIPYLAPVLFSLSIVMFISALQKNKWGYHKYFNVTRYKIDKRFKQGFTEDGMVPYKLNIYSVITPKVRRKIYYSIAYLILLLGGSIYITLKFRELINS